MVSHFFTKFSYFVCYNCCVPKSWILDSQISLVMQMINPFLMVSNPGSMHMTLRTYLDTFIITNTVHVAPNHYLTTNPLPPSLVFLSLSSVILSLKGEPQANHTLRRAGSPGNICWLGLKWSRSFIRLSHSHYTISNPHYPMESSFNRPAYFTANITSALVWGQL